ncbi:hypothetical protein [Rhizobium sp. GN54]|uniref:hypothetical protein n=1 Tax=Rhizobium sp. GN54 TaxID=2898150 RepID=UPI001E28E824|nr:hypothetical protein [Rhizobium sp. GN54]MCD2184833.1 hypothetical protein [Rhizobium sp. GN54]
MFETLFESDIGGTDAEELRDRYAIPLSVLVQKAAVIGFVPIIDRDVTASDVIGWRCSEGHEFQASWREQRHRRCPDCPALSYGERLARALFNYYLPEGKWHKVREKGFDPDNPDLRLEIDLVSDHHRITVECQSSLHDPDAPKQGLATKTPIDEIVRRDELKRALSSTHSRFKDYRHVELWLELAEVSKVVKRAVNERVDPIQEIVRIFFESLADSNVEVPGRPLPGFEELFSGFSEARRTSALLDENGLALRSGPWLGLTDLAVTCRSCGHDWRSSLSQLRRGWSRGRSGCANCWSIVLDQLSAERSDAGWAAFQELCADHGYVLLGPVSGPGNVEVKVKEKSTGRVATGRRHYIAGRLLDGLVVVDAKRIEYDKRRDRVAETISKHRAFLEAYGIRLALGQDRPTTSRGPDKQIRTNRFTIQYLGCQHFAKVPLGPFVQKLARHKSRTADGSPGLCPRCRREKIAQEKTAKMVAQAAKYGVTFLGPSYINATKTRYKFSCLPDCEEGLYSATFSNLEKNGVACRGCKRIRKRQQKAALRPPRNRR